jgi:hypothetical protein
MKTKYSFKALFSLLAALLCCYNSIAQDSLVKVQTIEIHPNGRYFKLPKYLEYGSFVQFEINNVNNLLYNADVAVTRSNITYDEIPDIFIINKAVEIADLVSTEESAHIKDKTKKDFEKKFDQIKTFNVRLKELKTKIDQIRIRAELYKELNELLEGTPFIKDIKALKSRAKKKHELAYQDGSLSIESLFEETDLIYKELSKTMESIKSEFYHGLKETKNNEKRQFENFFYTKNLEITQSQWKQAESAYEKLKDEENRKKIKEAAQAGIKLHNQIQASEYVLYTPPVKVNSDIIELTPKLYGKKDTITIKGDYIFRSRGGVKVNFSAGYLLSFRGDENYNLVKDADGNNIGVKKGNSSGLTHALGGLVHIYPRGYKNYQPGFSAGISTSDNGDLGFHLGGSLLATEGNNRVVFSAGVSFTSLQKLNRGNLRTENGNLLFTSSTDTEIKYDNVYKPSFFAGITFNLSKAADKQKDSED